MPACRPPHLLLLLLGLILLPLAPAAAAAAPPTPGAPAAAPGATGGPASTPAALAAPAARSAAPPALALTACKPPGFAQEVRCGRLEVPEDRAHPGGKKIGLRVVVVPAREAPRKPDPVFYFAGGPGDPASSEGAGVAADFRELFAHRDLVLVDARGTGGSNGLDCPALQGRRGVQGFLDSFLPEAGVRECLAQISAKGDPRFYTTAPAVDDVDDVRAVLGYDQINLMGGSYGTRAALEYLRRHGEHARTAVLDGVDPPGTKAPLTFARDAQAALDGLFARCDAQAACRAAFPRLREEFQDVLARLARAPAEVKLKDPETGQPFTLRLSRAGFGQTVRYMLYVPSMAYMIPLYVHAAAQGDFRPLGNTAVIFLTQLGELSDGFFLSVTCPEEVRKIRPEEVAPAVEGTFLGDFRIRQQQAACALWPRAEVPAALEEPVRSRVPALLIEGELDPVTPVYRAEQALRTLPRGRLVVVPGAGHGLNGVKNVECLSRLATRLIESGTAEALDTSCVATMEPPPFGLALPEEKEVHLTAAELASFAGRYAGDDGEVALAVDGDHLTAEVDGRKFLLEAIAARRFRIAGLPPGFAVEADAAGADGAAAGITVEQGPNQKSHYRRKP